MQCYTFKLDDETCNLYTIATRFGKYKYMRLMMGLKYSSNIAQEVTENDPRGIEEYDVYIENFKYFSQLTDAPPTSVS